MSRPRRLSRATPEAAPAVWPRDREAQLPEGPPTQAVRHHLLQSSLAIWGHGLRDSHFPPLFQHTHGSNESPHHLPLALWLPLSSHTGLPWHLGHHSHPDLRSSDCCSLCLECCSHRCPVAHFLASFMSLPRCHFLSEVSLIVLLKTAVPSLWTFCPLLYVYP